MIENYESLYLINNNLEYIRVKDLLASEMTVDLRCQLISSSSETMASAVPDSENLASGSNLRYVF